MSRCVSWLLVKGTEMRRLALSLTALSAMALLATGVSAKDCCPKPVKVKKVKTTCCQPCQQVVAPCCNTGAPAAVAPMAETAKPAATADKAPPAPPAEQATLYARLGGNKAITAVVDKFVARAAGNPKVNFFRKGTGKEWMPNEAGVAALKKHLVDLIGQVTGGPEKYTGKSMKESHAGMKITKDEFNALAGDLIATLDEFKVPQKEKDELIKIVAGTAADIVEQ